MWGTGTGIDLSGVYNTHTSVITFSSSRTKFLILTFAPAKTKKGQPIMGLFNERLQHVATSFLSVFGIHSEIGTKKIRQDIAMYWNLSLTQA